MRGKFITLEGIDGAGKSSHLEFIAGCIRERGFKVVTTREPGGTPLGEQLRTLVLNEKMHPDTEALLIFAARREHLAQIIEPALARGEWVISDRFTDATFAYQCGGRSLEEGRVHILEQWTQRGLQPDLTLLFDVAPDIARERVEKSTPQPDKFEREQADFFTRVREMYLKRAEQFPARIKKVDASLTFPEIHADLAALIKTL